MRAVFDAATDPPGAAVGVAGQRAGALERVGFVLADLAHLRAGITEVEARMVGVLDALELTELVDSIPGLSAVGAAAILAESGDPTRFCAARAWSSTPGCVHATTPPAPTTARAGSAAAAAPGCGGPPGGRCSPRCSTTRCWPPATPT